LKGRLRGSGMNGLGVVELEGETRQVLHCTMRMACNSSSEVFVSFHPEQVQIYSEMPADALNTLPGVISSRSNMGGFIDYRVQVGNQELRVNAARDTDLAEGEAVFLRVETRACLCLPN